MAAWCSQVSSTRRRALRLRATAPAAWHSKSALQLAAGQRWCSGARAIERIDLDGSSSAASHCFRFWEHRRPVTVAPLFELQGISKEFPGIKALDDVSLEIRAGEVHMLVGENGAGKSTLMKVLCGAYRADRGSFFHNGKPVTINDPAAARKFGIAVIFQDFTLVPYLDIAQNIFLGRELSGRLPGLIDRRRIHAEAKRVLDMIGFDIDTRILVHRLGVAQQQMVEIAKALSQDARILIMDEPTAALSDRETERLFAIVTRLKKNGVAITYISHRLSEVFAMGDRITVLRDGRKIASVLPAETTPDRLVTL